MNVSVWLQKQLEQRQRGAGNAQRSDRKRWVIWGAVACLAAVVLWPDLVALFRAEPPAPTSSVLTSPVPMSPTPTSSAAIPAEPVPLIATPAAVPPAAVPPSAVAPGAVPQPSPAPDSEQESAAAITVPAPTAEAASPTPLVSPTSRSAVPAHPAAPTVRAVRPPPSVPSHRTRLPSPAAQAETLYLKGMHLLRQERGVEAEPLLQQALQLDPGHAFARQALASVWIGEGRTLATEALLQQGLQLAPAESGWAMLLARLQVERGDRQAAIQTLRNSLAEASPLAVRHADPHAFLAALLQQQGDHDEAVARFTTALRLVPDKGIWWMGLGISLQAAGHAQQATAAYERALNANGLPAHLRAFVEQRLQQVSP